MTSSSLMKIFVLHSGGIDSSTALSIAVAEFGAANVLSVGINYGQRHAKELEYANKFCEQLGVSRIIVPMSEPPKSMLTDPGMAVPNISYSAIKGMSPTYVPFRNGQMLSRLAGIAQGWVMEQDNPDAQAQVWFGAHADDAANWAYPDCTPEFVGAMAAAIYIGTYHKVRLVTPFVHSTKGQIVEQGFNLDTDYSNTWSCYKGEELHCGTCPTCISRKEAFEAAGIDDPTVYADSEDVTEPV